ncbi:aldehyde dehydrogenase domain-containing protein [Roridomyces roridus]|uniref:Aldehyde dehydrogenase domain-containing protein n=1 Tax=Roridomyces roridus TaxID=1738132 RepID=A0AAD7FUK9_9AGAR|nr:aldehyde dehydrogenase domain-containing protein [Roridomyces roridus]
MTFTVPLLINGEEKITATTFPIESPVTHSTLWSCSLASSTDADAALAAASAAFPIWSKTKPAARRNILLKAADLIEQRADELKLAMQQETGSLDGFATFDTVTAAAHIRDVAGRISAIEGSIPISQDEGRAALVVKEPYGVVLALAPWNAPHILGVRSILFPLAAGNTCILKGPELSPRVYHHIGQIFTAAGLPPGALNILFTSREHSAAITTQLIEAPQVKKINFTGSSAVGAIIASTAGRALKPCLMELGGKAAAVVLDDADLELAAMQCVVGAFLHSGQICMATERVIVQKSILEPFRAALQHAAAGFEPPNSPAPVLVQAPAVERNCALVADALGKGAKLIHGDHTREEVHPETGVVSPTRMRALIVEGVTRDMRLYHEESFGPSVSLIAVDTEDEAVAIANDSEYGLNSAVFTKDLARGLRIAKRLESGSVHINSMSVHDEPSLPHGGVGRSGWGRFNGRWGIEEFLRTKTITFQE